MLLTELFDAPVQTKTTRDHDGAVIQRAALSDGTYIELYFDYMGLLPNAMSKWKFAFKRKQVKHGLGNKVRGMMGKEPKLSDGSYGKTGDGNEVEVFATVKNALAGFFKSHDPGQVIFTADKGMEGADESRASLYTAMIKRALPRNMYDVTITNEATFNQYTITKKQEFAPKQIKQEPQDVTQ